MVALFVSLLLSGCVSYVATLHLDRQAGVPAILDSSEQSAAIAVFERVALECGFRLNPDLDRLRLESERSKEYDDRIVSSYIVPRDGSYLDSVAYISIEKRTGELVVMLRDLNVPTPLEATKALEQSLTAALAREFPELRIRVERKHAL